MTRKAITLLMFISSVLPPAVLDCIMPRPAVDTAEWCSDHIRMPADSKVRGGFRNDLFPYFQEPFRCFDDRTHDTITVQSAAQIGKTTWAQACVAKTADTDPHPMAWGEPDESSTKRVISRTWRLMERTLSLQDKLPPKHLRSQKAIATGTFIIHGAWAGSPATAADFGAKVVVLNETDKMQHRSTDQEADFRFLLNERRKGYLGSKLLQMSTPTLLGHSYIERQRKLGDNRLWHIPCPRCGHFQPIGMVQPADEIKTPGGLIFEKRNGELDPATARQTARYRCENCDGEFAEHERYAVMQAGRYVPDGCAIDEDGQLHGEPLRAGSHASFWGLPTMVSLLPGITMGVVAEEYVNSQIDEEDGASRRQNFANSWQGITYDPRPVKVDLEELRARLFTDQPAEMWMCPEWSRFATVGSDVGRVEQTLIFYWAVVAWGYKRRGHVIGQGVTFGENDFRQQLLDWQKNGFDHVDEKSPCPLKRIVIDSGDGHDAAAVYEFTEPIRDCYPSKGSSSEVTDWFKLGFQQTNVPKRVLALRKKYNLGDLLIINTQRTQQWRVDVTTGLIEAGATNSLVVPKEICEDDEWLEQLIADYPEKSGRQVKWLKSGPNEGGDCVRYALVGAEHYGNRNGYAWKRLPSREPAKQSGTIQQPPPQQGGRFENPGGQAFVASQR